MKTRLSNKAAWQVPLFMALVMLSGIKAMAAEFRPSMTGTVTNKACYSGALKVNYTVTVPPPPGYIYPTNYNFLLEKTEFVLRKASDGPGGAVLATNFGGTTGTATISGSFDISALPETLFSATSPREDVYTIYATVFVNDIPTGQVVTVYSTFSFTIGYSVLWQYLTDMTTGTASNVSRNTVTFGIAWGIAKSSNTIPSKNVYSWIDVGAQFGASATPRSVHVMLRDFVPNTAVVPSTSAATYLEFRKGGVITATSGEGIYFKHGSSVYKLQNVTLTDRIRVERGASGNTKFYTTNSTTPLGWTYVSGVQTSAITLADAMFVMVYAPQDGDGITSPVTSFPCDASAGAYAQLERSLTGVNYTVSDKLYFGYDEEYLPVSSGTLNYRILNLQHKTLQSSAVVLGSTQVNVNRLYGYNQFELPLATSIASGGTYILEVTNEKKEVFYLRFTRK